jgi:hypothetical protein
VCELCCWGGWRTGLSPPHWACSCPRRRQTWSVAVPHRSSCHWWAWSPALWAWVGRASSPEEPRSSCKPPRTLRSQRRVGGGASACVCERLRGCSHLDSAPTLACPTAARLLTIHGVLWPVSHLTSARTLKVNRVRRFTPAEAASQTASVTTCAINGGHTSRLWSVSRVQSSGEVHLLWLTTQVGCEPNGEAYPLPMLGPVLTPDTYPTSAWSPRACKLQSRLNRHRMFS